MRARFSVGLVLSLFVYAACGGRLIQNGNEYGEPDSGAGSATGGSSSQGATSAMGATTSRGGRTGAAGAVASPLPGPAGNVEFFLWLRRDAAPTADAVEEMVRRAVDEGPR